MEIGDDAARPFAFREDENRIARFGIVQANAKCIAQQVVAYIHGLATQHDAACTADHFDRHLLAVELGQSTLLRPRSRWCGAGNVLLLMSAHDWLRIFLIFSKQYCRISTYTPGCRRTSTRPCGRC